MEGFARKTARAGAAALPLCLVLVATSLAGCDSATSPNAGASNRVLPADLDASGMKTAVLDTISSIDSLDRARRWVEIADLLDDENLPGALEAFDEELNRADEYEIRIFANKWAQLDPEGALDYITDNWRYPKATNQAVNEIFYVWARNDSAAAREYIAPSFEEPIAGRRSPKKFMVLATLRALAASGDLDELTRLFGSLEDNGDRNLWLTQVMREMNRARGNEATQAWVESIPWDTPNGVKRAAFNRALDWLARISPSGAAKWYEKFEGERDLSELLRPIVKAWGIQDPAATLMWLNDRPRNPTQLTYVREVYRGWFDWGPEYGEEAEAWTRANRGVELVEDPLVFMLTQVLVHQRRYEDAAEWINTARPEIRSKALPGVFAEWATLDASAVDAWVAANQISEEIVDDYRARVENNPVKVKRRRSQPPAKQIDEAK